MFTIVIVNTINVIPKLYILDFLCIEATFSFSWIIFLVITSLSLEVIFDISFSSFLSSIPLSTFTFAEVYAPIPVISLNLSSLIITSAVEYPITDVSFIYG